MDAAIAAPRVQVVDAGGQPIACIALQSGRLRCCHLGLFAGLGVLTGALAFGWLGAALVLLSALRQWCRCKPPESLVVRSGAPLWLCRWLLVAPLGWGHCACFYRDEMAHRDFVRLRRLLRRAARTPALEPLRAPAFDSV